MIQNYPKIQNTSPTPSLILPHLYGGNKRKCSLQRKKKTAFYWAKEMVSKNTHTLLGAALIHNKNPDSISTGISEVRWKRLTAFSSCMHSIRCVTARKSMLLIYLQEAEHGSSPSSKMNALCPRRFIWQQTTDPKRKIPHQERQNSKSTWSTCPVKCTAVPNSLQWPAASAVGLLYGVLKVWGSQHHRPSASKHLHYLKRLMRSMMSPAVNHRHFTRQNANRERSIAMTGIFSGCCHTQLALGVEEYDSAVLTLCYMKPVEIFEWCHSGMRSASHPFFFANSRNLGFFCFLLARDNWSISKIM